LGYPPGPRLSSRRPVEQDSARRGRIAWSRRGVPHEPTVVDDRERDARPERGDHGEWYLSRHASVEGPSGHPAGEGAPGRLDAAQANERGRKRAYVGIYTLEGDTLKWCVSPQKTRPETFETKKGQFLLILKRDRKPSGSAG
jgi:hypothetical protein